MPLVMHRISWFYIEISHYTAPVSGLGPIVTGVSVEFWLCTVYCICDLTVIQF